MLLCNYFHSKRGSVRAWLPAAPRRYPSGSFFGELEFLGFGSERLVSVRTKTFCEVSSLHPDDMEEVLRVVE